MVSSRIAARLVHTNPGKLIDPDNKSILMLLNLFDSSVANSTLQRLHASETLLVKVQEPCAISH